MPLAKQFPVHPEVKNGTWKERFWFLYRFLARLRLYFSRESIHESSEGERYHINPYSYVERCISVGDFEKTRASFLRQQLSPHDTFIDIGANIGFFTILAAKRGATVQSFEPDPINYERLLRNIKLNGFKEGQVVTHYGALGQTEGHVLLSRPLSDNYGRSSIVVENSPDGIRVPLKRLDDVLTILPQRYVVKVDVEGAELQVLDGAMVSLGQMSKGSLWLVEVHVGAGIEVRAVAERFLSHGYDISYFDDETGEITPEPRAAGDVLLVATSTKATALPTLA